MWREFLGRIVLDNVDYLIAYAEIIFTFLCALLKNHHLGFLRIILSRFPSQSCGISLNFSQLTTQPSALWANVSIRWYSARFFMIIILLIYKQRFFYAFYTWYSLPLSAAVPTLCLNLLHHAWCNLMDPHIHPTTMTCVTRNNWALKKTKIKIHLNQFFCANQLVDSVKN